MDLSIYESPAVKDLGPLFKLTEVHLWDDGLNGGRESHYSHEPIKHYNGCKDYEKRDYTRINGFSSLPEDLELVKELHDWGLPLSFHTNKEKRYGMTRSRRKGTRKYYQQTPKYNLSVEQRDSTSSISCTTTSSLSNEHDYNGEVSDLRSDHGSDCSSGVGNNILDEAESAQCKNEMMTTGLCPNGETMEGSCLINEGADCDGKEIKGELDSVHVEAFSQHDSEGQSNDMIDNHQIALCGEWIAYWDDFYRRTYFYNVKTEESTWDPPSGMEHLAYGNFADEPISIVDELAESDNDQMNFRNSDEVQASCDLQSHLYLAEESGNDNESLSQQLGEITGNGLTGDNVSGAYSTNRKKKGRRTQSIRKLSISTDDGILEEAAPSISKYWCQKYLLFSRFDCGIKMDEEGWFSVTPEAIAKHQAARCGTGVIVDLFTGTGGNAIQFAQRSKCVIAIDIDPNKIEYARHNAAIYEVHDTIDFINGDSFALAPNLKGDTVFMSPPWGGPDYSKVKKFDINTMLKPCDGQTLFNIGIGIAPQIVMFLPRNVDINQLAELALSTTPSWSLEVEKNFLNGRLKAITAYFSQPSETF